MDTACTQTWNWLVTLTRIGKHFIIKLHKGIQRRPRDWRDVPDSITRDCTLIYKKDLISACILDTVCTTCKSALVNITDFHELFPRSCFSFFYEYPQGRHSSLQICETMYRQKKKIAAFCFQFIYSWFQQENVLSWYKIPILSANKIRSPIYNTIETEP